MTFQKNDYQLLEAYLKAVSDPLPEMKKTFEEEEKILSNYVVVSERFTSGVAISTWHILDIGCGVGRPLISLAEAYRGVSYHGIDNDPKMLAIAALRINDHTFEKREDYFNRVSDGGHYYMYNPLNNISLENCDALNLPESYHNKFAMVYSTYNTIGSLEPKDWKKFVSEQAKALKKGGFAINFTWGRSDETTDFLKKYYSNIGLNIIDINKNKTIFDNSTIYRIHPEVISQVYKNSGITTTKIQQAGQWTAVIGQKL